MLSLMVSQALVLSIVESWIPVPVPVPVPGIKLGLANIVTMVAIVFMGTWNAFIVVVLRSILSSMFSGGLTVMLFSVAGGLLSTAIMSVLYNKFSKSFSIIGISITGAISHNIGQIAVAAIYMKDIAIFGYLPVLLVSGIIMGCFVGLCSSFLVKTLQKASAFR